MHLALVARGAHVQQSGSHLWCTIIAALPITILTAVLASIAVVLTVLLRLPLTVTDHNLLPATTPDSTHSSGSGSTWLLIAAVSQRFAIFAVVITITITTIAAAAVTRGAAAA
jgi:hypothetical protein